MCMSQSMMVAFHVEHETTAVLVTEDEEDYRRGRPRWDGIGSLRRAATFRLDKQRVKFHAKNVVVVQTYKYYKCKSDLHLVCYTNMLGACYLIEKLGAEKLARNSGNSS